MYLKMHGPITHEAGNMAEWSTATNAVASTTGAITGTYSGRAGSGAAAAVTMTKNPFDTAQIGGRCSRVYVTANWRPRQTPVGGTVLVLALSGDSGNAMIVNRNTSGVLYIAGDATGWSGVSNGTVYALELVGTYDGTGRLEKAELYVDGTLRSSVVGIATTAAAKPCYRLDGPSNTGAGKITQDDCIDDVNVYVSDPWS